MVASSPQPPQCPSLHLPAYAHNDYRNARPFYDALELGLAGVEVDVYLIRDTLRVGHSRREAASQPTLEELYLAPLVEVFRRCPGLDGAGRPLLLNIELKESSQAAYDALRRTILSHAALVQATSRGALDIVLVGWAPPATVLRPLARQHRITPESPLPSNAEVRLLTLDYGKTIGRWWYPPAVRQRWRSALSAAVAGKGTTRVRVHNIPAEPKLWTELLVQGVDLIGVRSLSGSADALDMLNRGAAVPPNGGAAGDSQPAQTRPDVASLGVRACSNLHEC